MITSIEYKNYKAFDEAEIPIKPITILLGANSVGKSSIIQSLLMFQQTGKAGLKSYKSALKLYGGYVNLGNPLNLFRKKNINIPLEFNFNIRSKELKEFFLEDLLSIYTRTFAEIPLFLPFKGFAEVRDNEIEGVKDFEKLINVLIEFLTKDSTKEKFQEEIKYFLKYRHSLSIPELNKKNKNKL